MSEEDLFSQKIESAADDVFGDESREIVRTL